MSGQALKGSENVPREILESKIGPLTNVQYDEIMDLLETDILVNGLYSKDNPGFDEMVEIAVSCFAAMSRGNVA